MNHPPAWTLLKLSQRMKLQMENLSDLRRDKPDGISTLLPTQAVVSESLEAQDRPPIRNQLRISLERPAKRF